MTVDEARTIAMAVCEKQGWYFSDPVNIYATRENWIITTNYHAIGCNASITVSKATREVIQTGYAPR